MKNKEQLKNCYRLKENKDTWHLIAMLGLRLDSELGENNSYKGHYRTTENYGIQSVDNSIVSILNFLKTLIKGEKSLSNRPIYHAYSSISFTI